MPRGDASPELIRQAALELFASHGIAATSLQMIADRLGVTKAAVYHHHRTKAAIAQAVLAPAMAEISDLVATAQRIADPVRAQERALELLASHAVVNRVLYGVILRELPAATLGDSEAHEAFEQLRRLLCAGRTDPRTITSVGIFLSGLTAPATDPKVAALGDEDLRLGILAAGRRLTRG